MKKQLAGIILGTMIFLCAVSLSTHGIAMGASQERRWAVVVGINDYLKEVTPLKCAVRDAETFKKTLVERAGFAENDVFLLTSKSTKGNKVPDKSNIIRWVSYVKQNARPGDIFVFFFSGHGIDMGKTSYLLTFESDPYSKDTLEFSALKVADLRRVIEEMPVSKKLIFVDACRSDPRSGKGDTDNKMTDSQSKDLIIKGATAQQGGAGQGESFSLTFFSCKVGERSYEWTEQGMGFFTYYLVKGLSGAAADNNGNITLGSFRKYIAGTVPKVLAQERGQGTKQTPWVDGDATLSSAEWVLSGGGKKGGQKTITGTTGSTTEESGGEKSYQNSTPDPEQAEKLRQRGDEFSKRKDYENAINSYNEAIRCNPKDTLSYESLGKIYARKGDYDRGIEAYSKAIALEPQNAERYIARGLANLKKKDYKSAASDFRTATEKDPSNAGAFLNLGIATESLGDHESAVKSLTKSLELYKNSEDALLWRGIAYNQKQEWQKALSDLEQAIQINPGSSSAYFYRGQAYEGMNRKAEAIAAYRKFLEIAPPSDALTGSAKERLTKLGGN